MERIQNNYLTAECTIYCAALHSLRINSLSRTVSLALKDEKEHTDSPTYSGNTIFPFAGRIENGVFGTLRLDQNEGKNSLHGGRDARKAVFTLKDISRTSVTYSLKRENGEDSIPSKREYTAKFSLEENSILIEYSMRSDTPVLCDMTNHLYLNLNGDEDIRDEFIKVDADEVVINDEDNIPRRLILVQNTPFDLRTLKKLGDIIDKKELSPSKGLNNAYLLNNGKQAILQGKDIKMVATSNSEAVVIYSGGYLEKKSSFVAIEFQSVPLNAMRPVTDNFHRWIRFSFQNLS